MCSLPWIQGLAPEDGKPPLPPKCFTTPTRATGLTGPQRLLPAPWCPLYISSVQSLSHVQLFAISWGAACQASLSIRNSRSLLKLMFIRLVMPPNNLIFCLPLCLLPLIFPCIRVFPNASVLPIRWPKYWRFSFSIGPSNVFKPSSHSSWVTMGKLQGFTCKMVGKYLLRQKDEFNARNIQPSILTIFYSWYAYLLVVIKEFA